MLSSLIFGIVIVDLLCKATNLFAGMWAFLRCLLSVRQNECMKIVTSEKVKLELNCTMKKANAHRMGMSDMVYDLEVEVALLRGFRLILSSSFK